MGDSGIGEEKRKAPGRTQERGWGGRGGEGGNEEQKEGG